MNSHTGGGGEADTNSRPAPDFIGQLAFRVATQLFGGRVNSTNRPKSQDQQPKAPAAKQGSARLAHDAARILERALAQVESLLGAEQEATALPAPPEEESRAMPQDQMNRDATPGDVSHKIEEALERLAAQMERLSKEVSRLSLVADRLEAELSTLGNGRGSAESAPDEGGATASEPVTAPEPQFPPGDRPVGIVVGAVPGFQGLMDVQRGLTDLAAVKAASVQSYRNDEASMELALHTPVSARQVVEGLREATGHELIIEESRPEELRLRLRFSNHVSRGSPAERSG